MRLVSKIQSLFLVSFYFMDWGIYTNSAKPLLSITDTLLIALDLVAFVAVILTGKIRVRFLIVPVLVFIFLSIGYMGGIKDFNSYVGSSIRMAFYGLSVFIIGTYYQLVRRESHDEYINQIGLLIICGVVAGILSIIQYSWFILTSDVLKLNPFTEQRYFGAGFGYRSPGLTSEPSFNAYLLSIALVFNLLGVSNYSRHIRWIFTMIICTGILTTFSAGSFLCLSILLLYWILKYYIISSKVHLSGKKLSSFFIYLLALLLIVLISTFILAERLLAESISLTSFVDGEFSYSSSISTRLVAFYTVSLMLTNFPLFGFGIGQNIMILELLKLDEYNYSGSGFMGVILVYTGMLGFSIFSLLLFFINRLFLKKSSEVVHIGFILLIIFFSINMSSIFTSDFWGFILILMTIHSNFKNVLLNK
jgi:hypothetical protein